MIAFEGGSTPKAVFDDIYLLSEMDFLEGNLFHLPLIDLVLVCCRLSDYLFTVARFAARMEGRQEKIYRRISREDLHPDSDEDT